MIFIMLFSLNQRVRIKSSYNEGKIYRIVWMEAIKGKGIMFKGLNLQGIKIKKLADSLVHHLPSLSIYLYIYRSIYLSIYLYIYLTC